MFILRKLLEILTSPTALIVWLALFAAILFCFHHKTARRLAAIAGGAALCLLLIFSTGPVPTYMIARLESPYQPLQNPPPHVTTIVVLGGGTIGNAAYPVTMRVSSASEARLLEGIRLYHLIPQARLILSGGRVFGQAADATTMNNVAVMLGIKPRDIEIEPGSQNTEQEVQLLKTRLQNQDFILVTSAYHMKRAMYLFEAAGLHPIPAPTQFTNDALRRWTHFFPSSSNLSIASTALHEYVGLWYAYWRQRE